MASNLTAEFTAGYQARIDAGRCLERAPAACPHIATSNCADAWHAGFAHAANAMAGNELARDAIKRAWHGRGYIVNVETHHRSATRKLAYRVDYDRVGPTLAYLLEA